MTAQASLSLQGDTLIVAGVLDHESVLSLEAQGATWLADTAPATCYADLTQVSYSSSAGIALLLSWLRHAQQQHKTLRLRPLPTKLAGLVRLSGLDEVFGPLIAEAKAPPAKA